MFGKEIKILRKNKGMKLQEVVEKLNEFSKDETVKFNTSKLSRIEQNKQDISSEELRIIQEFFNEELINFSIWNITNENLQELKRALLKIPEFKGKLTKFKEHPFKDLITKELPTELLTSCEVDLSKYTCVGSAGKGQFATVPWICFFDCRITTTAQKGVYIVILIKADFSAFYISLNQGFTYYSQEAKNTGGSKIARKNIRIVSNKIKEELKEIYSSDLVEEIELGSAQGLVKGYEAGNIYAKEFKLDENLDIVEFKETLKKFFCMYDEIVNLIDNRSFDEFVNYTLLAEDKEIVLVEENDMEKQVEANGYVPPADLEFENEPSKKKQVVINGKGKKSYPRSIKVLKDALALEDYKCAYDESYEGFIKKSDGMPYVEGHHLIPLSMHDLFEYSLDIVNNIVSLSPYIHRLLHHGFDEEKKIILSKLYDQRKELLRKVGIEITLEKLYSFYDIY